MSLIIQIHDVGHGHAVHAFTPNGEVIVIDLGSSKDYSPLAFLARTTSLIDQLVLSHPHADHLSEVPYLHNFTIRQLSRPKWLTREEVGFQNKSTDSALIDAYYSFSAKYTNPIPDNELVGNPVVSGGVTFRSFYTPNCGRSNINNHSAVCVFSYLGVNVIIPGDNESPSWKELLNNSEFTAFLPQTAFFLASHHGREAGFCQDLFIEGRLKPKLCAISDGPVVDTDATSDYSRVAEGWWVQSHSLGEASNRSCVTTRKDGVITVEIGRNPSSGKPFMSVKTTQ